MSTAYFAQSQTTLFPFILFMGGSVRGEIARGGKRPGGNCQGGNFPWGEVPGVESAGGEVSGHHVRMPKAQFLAPYCFSFI